METLFMRSVGETFIDPSLVWPAIFAYRTTLIQKRSTSEEDHGWCVVEVSKRFLGMDEPFGRVRSCGEEAYGLDSLQLKFQWQWRRGCWLTKDDSDHDVIALGSP